MHIADLCISKAFPAKENVDIHKCNNVSVGEGKLARATCKSAVLQMSYHHVHLKTLLSVLTGIAGQLCTISWKNCKTHLE